MLVLFETAAGFALFKLLNDSKLKQSENLYLDFQSPEAASQIVKLKHFERFVDTTEALAANVALEDGKISKRLKKILKKCINEDVQDQLLVSDAKLGNLIKEKYSMQCVSNSAVQELMRCIRSQMDGLISDLSNKDFAAMALGLAHSLARYRLKFSADKLDTMIVQAVCLLDDLDKELNNYVMRCREWYGWHFPEMGKIVTDNIAFVKTVKLIGTRDNTSTTDLSDILPEEIETRIKEAAEISMGTEISDDDITNIQNLCDQVIEISEYRTQLYDYLKNRMMTMAPNLTVLIGELVGARLIAKAGSLMSLAKQPASTIQILGAEKALFTALKSKRDTPKFGIIYHAQLLGQASTRNKGKMARMLAAKAALAVRVDALCEEADFKLGAEHKVKLENKLRLLEEGNIKRISGTGKARAKFQKYHGVSEIKQYPSAADSTLPSGSKRKREEELPGEEDEAESEVPPKKIKKEKRIKEEPGQEDALAASTEKKKKDKKSKVQTSEIKQEENGDHGAAEETPSKKKKKKKKQLDVEEQE